MQFNDYVTMRPREYRGTTEKFIAELMQTACKKPSQATIRGAIESSWLQHDRPFYNVYPIAVELCHKTSLNMKWGDIAFPTRNLLLRFACGHEPLGISAALLRVPSNQKHSTRLRLHTSRIREALTFGKCPLGGVIENGRDKYSWIWMYSPDKEIRDEVISDTLPNDNFGFIDGFDGFSDSPIPEDRSTVANDQFPFLIRLLAFIGLLARGTDLITPAILSSDRDEYDGTSDEARKRWLENRAARRQGAGFDIGRALEVERAASPHWRSPHLALFHTGPGRTTPVLKMRSGCVVIPRDMSHVPTGYLGDESQAECDCEGGGEKAWRTSVPHGTRMRILARDGRRCRVCGMTADDGVTLEVDHILPVAKGGGNEDENLWVLCRPCNSGKSNLLLPNITPTNEGVVSHGL